MREVNGEWGIVNSEWAMGPSMKHLEVEGRIVSFGEVGSWESGVCSQ